MTALRPADLDRRHMAAPHSSGSRRFVWTRFTSLKTLDVMTKDIEMVPRRITFDNYITGLRLSGRGGG